MGPTRRPLLRCGRVARCTSVTTKRLAACMLGFLAAMAFVAAAPTAPTASADPCPDVAIVFARGTDEPAGVGAVGQGFVDALGSRVGSRTVGVYAVNYPASSDLKNSPAAGAADAISHVSGLVSVCPDTRIVLGGHSQGAAVMELVSNQLTPNVANHVAANAMFGTPRSGIAQIIFLGNPLPTLAPRFAERTIDLCAPGDLVCGPGLNYAAHMAYVENGMVNQAADFVAGRL